MEKQGYSSPKSSKAPLKETSSGGSIKAWLTAGVLENTTLTATVEGAPQGSIISPLLANIALLPIETDYDLHFMAAFFRSNVSP